MYQVEMVSLDSSFLQIMPIESPHRYRVFNQSRKKIKSLEKSNPYKGYGLLRLFKCLLLQFREDTSDRELEKFLQGNNAAQWFCGFTLTDKTPDHSVFSKVRKRLGTKLLSKIFSDLHDQLKQHGCYE